MDIGDAAVRQRIIVIKFEGLRGFISHCSRLFLQDLTLAGQSVSII
jgi:hypothetical protein